MLRLDSEGIDLLERLEYMKGTCFVAILVFISVAIFSPAIAQQTVPTTAPLSLQDCINIAFQNQADVIVAQNNVVISKAKATQARGAYWPQISVENNAFVLGSGGGLTQYNTGTALVVTQNIFDGGLREAQNSAAKYGIRQNQAGLTRTTQTVAYSVTKAYYDALRSKRLATVAAKSVKYNEGLRDMVQTRIKLGDAAEVDVLPVEAQLANAQVTYLTAQNQVNTSLIQLQNVMGLSPTPNFDIADSDGAPSSVDVKPLDKYMIAAVMTRPDVSEAAASIGAAKASVRSAKIQMYPRPVISGQYQAGIAGPNKTSAQMVGGIQFDLFNGGANRATLRQARANQANAEQLSKQVIKDIQAQVQQAYLNLASSKERLNASTIGLNAAQRNYDVQSARYKQGLAIPLDLINAELQVVTAQTNDVQARYDYYVAVAQLEYAVGDGGQSGTK